jgi:hypothetical protein
MITNQPLTASKVLEPLKKDFSLADVLKRLDEADEFDRQMMAKRQAARKPLDLGDDVMQSNPKS